jgi:hypothetical protein
MACRRTIKLARIPGRRRETIVWQPFLFLQSIWRSVPLYKIDKLQNLRLAKTKQGEALTRDMRDNVNSYERSVERVLSRPAGPETISREGIYHLDRSTNSDLVEISVPMLAPEFTGSCPSSTRIPRVRDLYLRDARAAATQVGGGARDLRADLRDFIINSGRLTGLATALRSPTQVFRAPPDGQEDYSYSVNPYQRSTTFFLRDTIPTPQGVPVPDENKAIASTNHNLTPAQRRQGNLALTHFLQLARSGNSSFTNPMRNVDGFTANFMPPNGENPQEWAIQQLMKDPDVLRLFARTTREHGQQWNLTGVDQSNEEAVDNAIVDIIKRSVENPAAAGAQRLQASIPVFRNSKLCHIQSMAQNRGAIDQVSLDRNMEYADKWAHNPRSHVPFEVDSCVEMRALRDVRRDMEDLDDSLKEDMKNLDGEITAAKTDKDYWDKYLQSAQAELPRAIVRPMGQQT